MGPVCGVCSRARGETPGAFGASTSARTGCRSRLRTGKYPSRPQSNTLSLFSSNQEALSPASVCQRLTGRVQRNFSKIRKQEGVVRGLAPRGDRTVRSPVGQLLLRPRESGPRRAQDHLTSQKKDVYGRASDIEMLAQTLSFFMHCGNKKKETKGGTMKRKRRRKI